MNKRLPLSAGTVLQSRYTVVGQLGHGGMGAVYEAKDNRTSATVALKETYADDDYMRNAFEREAKMLANMTHEAFPRVMDYFAEDDGFYLVMELIRGKDLSELLEERNAPFETEQVLDWADQILDALEDLHSQDIVHRDIKPSNLKLTPRGRIKLLDFGIAKGAAGDMTALQSTVGSMAAATLQYAPLEQVLRADLNWFQMLCVNFSDKTLSILDHGTDARSDLYALGATLYHLLTNTLPVNAPTRALSVWSGLADKLRPAHEINPNVASSVSAGLQQALEIDREIRPSTAAEMRKMLRESGTTKDEAVVHADKETILVPILPFIQKQEELNESDDLSGKNDPLFRDALHVIVQEKRASTVVLQRQMEIGYERAAKIFDAMVGEGFIGEVDVKTGACFLLPAAYDALQNLQSEMSEIEIQTRLKSKSPAVSQSRVINSERVRVWKYAWIVIILGLLSSVYTGSVIPIAFAGIVVLISAIVRVLFRNVVDGRK